MSGSEGGRLVISEQDLMEPAPRSAAPVTASSAAPLPPVQGISPAVVGATARAAAVPSAGSGAAWRTPQARNALASAAAILLGFGVTQILGVPNWRAHSSLGLDTHAGVWVALLGLIFAVVFSGWEQICAGNWEGVGRWLKAAGPAGLGLGFVSGFLAQAVYIHFVDQIFRHITLEGVVHLQSNVDLYLARALAWGMFGLGMGVAVAGGLRPSRKLVNGAAGGAIGGALGGLVFHWCSFHIHSGGLARLIGLLVVGLAIGASIGIVERLRREAWLRVIGGPLIGKEFIVYGSRFTVGRSPQCDVILPKDETIDPLHAILTTTQEADGESRMLERCGTGAVLVNGVAVDRRRLRPGDQIGVGSFTIEYGEQAV